MSRNLRLTLTVIGLALVAVSLAALVFALSPAGRVSEQQPISATQMAP